LTPLDPLQIESVNVRYAELTKHSLHQTILEETDGKFGDTLSAIVRGPLKFTAWLVIRATDRLGTNEGLLNLALLGRSNADINAIKPVFKTMHPSHWTLEETVRKDLKGDAERMFDMVLAATRTEDSAGVNYQQVTAEVKALHAATEGRAGTDQIEVFRIFIKSNDATLHAIAIEYEKTHHILLETVIKREFKGDVEDALLFILNGVLNRAKRDAQLIEGTMKGIGTKDEELSYRLVDAHWRPGHIAAIKREYHALYHKELVVAVKSETRGDFENVLVAMLA